MLEALILVIKHNQQETNKQQTSNSLVQGIVLGTRKQDLSHVIRTNLINYIAAVYTK